VTLADPEEALVPLQSPEAVQDVASVEDQVSVLLPPAEIDVGLAEILTVGIGVGVAPSLEPPPQAASEIRHASNRTRAGKLRKVRMCIVRGPCAWREYTPSR
jgi:hypothetical protein